MEITEQLIASEVHDTFPVLAAAVVYECLGTRRPNTHLRDIRLERRKRKARLVRDRQTLLMRIANFGRLQLLK